MNWRSIGEELIIESMGMYLIVSEAKGGVTDVVSILSLRILMILERYALLMFTLVERESMRILFITFSWRWDVLRYPGNNVLIGVDTIRVDTIHPIAIRMTKIDNMTLVRDIFIDHTSLNEFSLINVSLNFFCVLNRVDVLLDSFIFK